MHPTIAALRDAMNAHDPDAMHALFTPDYRSEQPAHPNRGFGGRDQVRANWTNMFAGVPNMTVEVRATTTDGTTSWSEWDWRGTHTDGSPFGMRGVLLMTHSEDGRIAAMRLYMEPVEQDGAAIEETVQQLSGAPQ